MLYDNYEISQYHFTPQTYLTKYCDKIKAIINITFYKHGEIFKSEMQSFLINISWKNIERFGRSYSTICYNY